MGGTPRSLDFFMCPAFGELSNRFRLSERRLNTCDKCAHYYLKLHVLDGLLNRILSIK